MPLRSRPTAAASSSAIGWKAILANYLSQSMLGSTIWRLSIVTAKDLLTVLSFTRLVAATVRDVKDAPASLQNALFHSAIKKPSRFLARSWHKRSIASGLM